MKLSISFFIYPKRIFLYLCFFISIIITVDVKAQQILVCDAISRFPVRDVEVCVDGQFIGKTIYLGTVTLPKQFKQASFKAKGYSSEKLTREEVLRDTVFLFPSKHSLNEVVVIGKHKLNIDSLSRNMSKKELYDYGYIKSSGVGSFDFATVLDRRLNRDREHVQQDKEIIKKLNGKNIIEQIYTEEIEKKRVLDAAFERRKIPKDNISTYSFTTKPQNKNK